MSGCTATIIVDGQTITCTSHDELSMYTHSDGLLGWSDLAPGATPAKPKYRVVEWSSVGGCMVVTSNGEIPVVRFYGSEHPDPRGAAEAEAARLNGGGPSHEDWQQAVLHQQQAVRERDAARAEAEDHRLAMVEADRQCDQAQVERDRLRAALEWIIDLPGGSLWRARYVARRVLDGGDA